MTLTAIKKTEITLGSLVENFAAYNLWANNKTVKWLEGKPLELLDAEIPSSFSSIKKTLSHILQTQQWWLEVMKGLKPVLNYGITYAGTTHELFKGLIDHSEDVVSYIDALSKEAKQEICNFSIPHVGDFKQPRIEMVIHLVNHTTYHRGQVITIGRNVGMTDAPMTDYMFYLIMGKI